MRRRKKRPNCQIKKMKGQINSNSSCSRKEKKIKKRKKERNKKQEEKDKKQEEQAGK